MSSKRNFGKRQSEQIDQNSQLNQENLWEEILQEAMTDNKFQNANLLILGNKNSGKRTFINQIQEISNTVFPYRKNDQQSDKLGQKNMTTTIDYTYINIKNLDDPENEISSKISVYVVDDKKQKNLLDILLNKDFVKKLIIVISLDLEEPWTFMQTLEEWMEIIIDKLTNLNIPLNDLDEMRDKIQDYIRNYQEPQFDEEGKLITQQKNKLQLQDDQYEEIKQKMPLAQGVLTINCGVPIIIQINKTDLIENLEKDVDGQKKIDFIQFRIRKFAVQYGAAILYTSYKNKINLDLFYEYILHRFYDFAFKFGSEALNKESIFLPSGYDNLQLINESYKDYEQETIYENFIIQPNQFNQKQEVEIKIKDEQQFLEELRQKSLEQRDNPGSLMSSSTLGQARLQSQLSIGQSFDTSKASSYLANQFMMSKNNPITQNQNKQETSAFFDNLKNNQNSNLNTTANSLLHQQQKQKAEQEIIKKIEKYQQDPNYSQKQNMKRNDSQKIIDFVSRNLKKQ